MNTPRSLTSKNDNFINLIIKNWSNLNDSQKEPLIKIWKVLTYKWQLQILLNLPFLIWWLMDISFTQVHTFDLQLISYLNLPEWAVSFMGFGKTTS